MGAVVSGMAMSPHRSASAMPPGLPLGSVSQGDGLGPLGAKSGSRWSVAPQRSRFARHAPAPTAPSVPQSPLTGAVDKVVVVKSASSTSPPWALIVISGLLAALGVVLLGLAARRNQGDATEAAAAPKTSPAREPQSERRR